MIHSCISSLPSNISVSDMVHVFDDVREKLRKDGTCWLHISNKWPGSAWKYIFAMRDKGWYLRSVAVWVRDDVDRDYDYVVLFAKSDRYYYNQDAIRERYRYDGRKDMLMKGAAKFSGNDYLPNGIGGQSFHEGSHERWPHMLGRNRLNVFDRIGFDEMIGICIDAGTSERVCEICGKQWVGVVEIKDAGREWMIRCGAEKSLKYSGRGLKDYDGAMAQNPSVKRRILDGLDGLSYRMLVDWKCDCEHDDGSMKAVIYDPFNILAIRNKIIDMGRIYYDEND